MTPAGAAQQVGDVLAGHYRLLGILGRGGTGTVWAAQDLNTLREVAVKLLHPELTRDARLRRRLRREARAVARLEHPNIVRLYEMGEMPDGSPYLAMELVRGVSLHRLAQTPLTWVRTLALFDQVLIALAFAHARGVVHRDLKPQNVFVVRGSVLAGSGGSPGTSGAYPSLGPSLGSGPSGASGALGPAYPGTDDLVKLLDFGFAHVENDADDQLTAATKDVFGTPIYMSPEQATGDHEVGPAADLYGVGVMLWEVLCGAPPFLGASGTAVVVQHVTAPLPPFRPRADLDLPLGVEAVLRMALEKEPVRRHSSAAAFRRALLAAAEEPAGDEDTGTLTSAPFAAPPTFERTPTDVSMTTVTEAVLRTGEHAVLRTGDHPALAVGAAGGATGGAGEPVGRQVPRSQLAATPAGHEVPGVLVGGADLAPPTVEPPLVGRDALQRWLWERAVHTCQAGQPHFVLLEGPVGIGKTRLGMWLHETMAEGGWMWPLFGRFRAGNPDGGLREAVRGALGAPRRRPPEGRNVLRTCLAELDRDDVLDADALSAWLWPAAGQRAPQGQVLRAVEKLIRLLAKRRPLYIFLDDAQCADGEAFALLDHLAAQLTSRPAAIFVVGTRRTDAPAASTPAPEAVTAFLGRHHERIEIREVPRLDEASLQSLASAATPLDPSAAAFVAEGARGNPLHALETIRYLRDLGTLRRDQAALLASGGRSVSRLTGVRPQVPRGPLELVRARLTTALRAREPEVRALAERLALLGDTFSFALAEALARRVGLDAVRLDMGIETLVELGILADEATETYTFRHELVREALLDELEGRADAPAAHLAVAETRLQLAGDSPGAMAAEIARHLRAAGDLPAAVSLLLDGARAARALGQAPVAFSHCQSAERWLADAEPSPAILALTAECWRTLAELALDAGEHDRTARLAERLEASARLARDPVRAADAQRLRGEALLAAGRWLEAERVLGEARAGFAASGPLRSLAQVDLALGRAALQSSQVELARACFTRAAAGFAAAQDRGGEAACRRALGELAVRSGDRAAATRLLTEAAAMGEEAQDHSLVGQAASRLGDLLRQGGQMEAAVARYQQAVEHCETAGDAAGLGRALRGLGDTERLLRRASAETSYHWAVEVFESVGDLFQLAICHTQLGRMAAERDDLIVAEAAFEHALRTLENFDDPVRVGVLHAYLARVADRRGDKIARDYRLQVALRIDAHRPLVVQEWPVILEEVATHLVAEGDPHKARPLWERAGQIWTALGKAEDAARCVAMVGR